MSDFNTLVNDCCLNLRKLSEKWDVKYNTAKRWSDGTNPAPPERIKQLRKLSKKQEEIFR